MNPNKKILIIDDEFFFRKILTDALSNGYDIIEGENGDEAISLALAHKPNLIIMDVEMPVKSGIEACKVLKSIAETSHIPVILFTSRSKKEDLILGLKAGADDYITKPINLSEVLARVDAHLRTRDYYTELEHKDLLFLLELSENISALRSPMAILRLIVDRMNDIVDVSRCSIVSINDSGEAFVKASSDLKMNDEIKLELFKYPEIRKSFESKQTVIVNDIKTDPLMNSVREYIQDLDYNSIVVIPIIKKESVIGTFFLRTASPYKNGITVRIQKLCQLVANISANALENAILFESMKTAQEYFEDMSIRDGLTKLYNHRHFYNRLEEEFSRANRYNSPLSLIFFDIDDFKRVNDIYGHTKGDKVLKQIGQLLKSVARESDIAARYGGEEFALLLPNTNAAGALDVTNRLSAIIREHKFEKMNGEQITISAGTATLLGKNIESYEQLVRLADDAMYKAKKHGKDCITQA
ncbi:MAG: diguanylate cyclase [Desulfuromonadales bacterium]|nr:diguanylate cyclase [Desulfuromonadales bacterium]